MISAPELDLIDILSRQAVKEYMASQRTEDSDPANRQANAAPGSDSGNSVQIGSFTDRKIGRRVAA